MVLLIKSNFLIRALLQPIFLKTRVRILLKLCVGVKTLSAAFIICHLSKILERLCFIENSKFWTNTLHIHRKSQIFRLDAIMMRLMQL